MQREVVIFAGNVQGVGFRHSTWTIARNYDVSGFVRNLPDGRVELMVEGELPEVVRFVADVRERLAHYIRSVTADRQPATGEFSRFEIRH